VDFNTAGSSFDTTLGVYTGNGVTNLTVIAGNNNDAGSLVSSRVDFPATAGTRYRIAVDGFGAEVDAEYQVGPNFLARAVGTPIGAK
jgi:hypothetical protein